MSLLVIWFPSLTFSDPGSFEKGVSETVTLKIILLHCIVNCEAGVLANVFAQVNVRFSAVKTFVCK